MIRLLIICVLLVLTSKTYAVPIVSGHERGNGGLQLQCSEESSYGSGIVSLDRAEGYLRDGRSPAKSLFAYTDENDIVRYILAKLEKVNPTRAGVYRRLFEELLERRIFVEDLVIAPTNDGDVVLQPPHCHLIQGSVFISSVVQENVSYVFDKASWERTSALDRAYLIMHELIYREALLPENAHQNSAAARNLNSWLFSKVDDLEQNGWNEQLAQNSFSYGDYNGIAIQLVYTQALSRKRGPAPVKYYPSGALHKAVLYSSFVLKNTSSAPFIRQCKPAAHTLTFDSYVEFYPSGEIKRLVFSEPLFKFPGCDLYLGKYNDLTFSQSGEVVRVDRVFPPFFDSF
ncbi:hypothetical protein [Bdellovibrio sp.]|uniref:hypothetical protein n=1 Tax=Bdellovibrio sp. TaxID=28201 RepID=UPI0039E36F98